MRVAPEKVVRPPVQSMDVDPMDVLNNAAYKTLAENDLICNKYLVEDVREIDTMPGMWGTTQSLLLKCVTGPMLCYLCCTLDFFTVTEGNVRAATHSDGRYIFFGPGIHVRNKLYYQLAGNERSLVSGAIIHGTKALVTVTQGLVGLAFDQGHPVLLPPGLHQWDNPTLKFEKIIDLSSSLIKIGPYTLVTVDQGYAAITQDNGKQKVLDGGMAYMLTHQNWKFISFLSMKIQVDTIASTTVTTGDNIGLSIKANVTWQVEDPVAVAATTVDNAHASKADDPDGLKSVRSDVIRQVVSSLAYMVGGIQFGARGQAGLVNRTAHGLSDDSCMTAGSCGIQVGVAIESEQRSCGRKALFDPCKLETCVEHANAICVRYGVNILSINLVEATPVDADLVEIIASAAIASATAEQSARTAQGEANVVLIQSRVQAAKAEAEAEAMMIQVRAGAEAVKIAATAAAEAEKIKAEADSVSERMRGQGARDAGKMMEESDAAVAMAKLKIAYAPLSSPSTFYFGLNKTCNLGSAILGKTFADHNTTRGVGSVAEEDCN